MQDEDATRNTQDAKRNPTPFVSLQGTEAAQPRPIAAIVLAAGTSSRHGGTNKLLLPFRDGTVIRSTVQVVRNAGIAHVVVVTGHERQRIEAALATLPVTFVHNPRYREGEMLSSIKAGLTHLQATDAEAAFIVPGDQPLLPAWLLRRIRQAFEQGCGEIIAPKFGDVRGHPVLIARRWWPAALALPDGAQMRMLLRANPQAVAHILVNTDAVLLDVDTPEAYQRALERSGIEN
ncbi:MAG: nucleotidyltransferase family protein [Anaerolineae bacterium]|nr:nucleotidyltransferase family protein [Candidatus Roseilinea sp.]MDW8448596.1 nucleotidyltransferase family protein [Anaerolineae bacterium]